ncbi:Deoxyguanosinetriphosphate triphosphohydrolase-like protein [bioreactor metagenome]|uniref:Deoxyguanosinetriphosphate triphosphohydrolase-like protein n=1 Tax=bioreactor metagenome TaxID=1076179 RepID=A0A645F1V5_9ZZZZ
MAERLENEGKGLNLTVEVLDGILNHRGGCRAKTLEGDIVRFSDKVAYLNHDIDDAIRGNVLKLGQIPKEILDALGYTHKDRINTLVLDIIKNSRDQKIEMSAPMQEKMSRLREFMFQAVYQSDRAREQEEKARHVVTSLYQYFLKRPEKMPDEFLQTVQKEGAARGVCDYIAGMTDQYCIDLFCSLFIPQSWQIK